MHPTGRNIQIIISCMFLLSLFTNHAAFAKKQQLGPELIKGSNLKIDIPTDWEQGAISGESILLCRSPNGKLYPNINISVMKQKYDSLKDAHQKVVALLHNPQTSSEEQVTINGIPGYFSAITWMSPLGGLKALRLLVEEDQKIILITYVGRDDSMTEEDVQLYLKSLNSIRHTN